MGGGARGDPGIDRVKSGTVNCQPNAAFNALGLTRLSANVAVGTALTSTTTRGCFPCVEPAQSTHLGKALLSELSETPTFGRKSWDACPRTAPRHGCSLYSGRPRCLRSAL